MATAKRSRRWSNVGASAWNKRSDEWRRARVRTRHHDSERAARSVISTPTLANEFDRTRSEAANVTAFRPRHCCSVEAPTFVGQGAGATPGGTALQLDRIPF